MKKHPEDERYQNQFGSSLRALSDYLGLGIQIAAGFVFFVFAGYWADGQFGTSPFLLIAGVFMGMAGMVLVLMKTLKIANRKKQG
ncbi:AtpZ/AtpI family protein [Chlorobium sp.]|uniref:AtpZ/AtpI family protein n=1 Tax=Chlorobium sp. TaxID=1095 RepID=UPI002F3EB40A